MGGVSWHHRDEHLSCLLMTALQPKIGLATLKSKCVMLSIIPRSPTSRIPKFCITSCIQQCLDHFCGILIYHCCKYQGGFPSCVYCIYVCAGIEQHSGNSRIVVPVGRIM